MSMSCESAGIFLGNDAKTSASDPKRTVKDLVFAGMPELATQRGKYG